jgi:UDP-N-acetyl-D-mannosaminuronate dehydrogenase
MQLLRDRGKEPSSSRVLVLGATFKKDIVDQRNSKALVLSELLASQFEDVHVHDPLILDEEDQGQGSQYAMVGDPLESGVKYDLVVVAVAHSVFSTIQRQLDDLVLDDGVIMDLTGDFAPLQGETSQRAYWCL